jgi:hypothetical protein
MNQQCLWLAHHQLATHHRVAVCGNNLCFAAKLVYETLDLYGSLGNPGPIRSDVSLHHDVCSS